MLVKVWTFLARGLWLGIRPTVRPDDSKLARRSPAPGTARTASGAVGVRRARTRLITPDYTWRALGRDALTEIHCLPQDPSLRA
jgi:hypothetical protein